MPNNPVQIVLNSSNFIGDWERQAHSTIKDFYAGRDDEFALHKQNIANQLAAIHEEMLGNEFADTTYVKLILNQSALSKTNRPTQKLFKKDIAPVVGAGDIGELYVEVNPDSIIRITDKVLSAEDKVENKPKDGKLVPKPSKIRSEVGAINEVRTYTATDKRSFSVTQGLEWLSNPKTGGAYIIELFETPPPRQNWDILSLRKRKLFESFENGLTEFGQGLVATRLLDSGTNASMIGIRLENSEDAPRVQLFPTRSSAKPMMVEPNSLNFNEQRHEALINFLDNHPLVKKINLPPIISRSTPQQVNTKKRGVFQLPSPNIKNNYPLVGIIDGGISPVLKEWIAGEHEFLHPSDREESHATFIGGLLVSGNAINGSDICKEMDGCRLLDVAVLPRDEKFRSYYINSPLEFFKELSIAISELKQQTGVRIFNFSLNTQEHVSSDGYSNPAKYLDAIAQEHDVIFVVSAGNTHPNDVREEWPKDPAKALAILASCRNHILKSPAESCRNLSVAAVNAPNVKGSIPFAPANYSCQGPGMRVGIKPDLAHIGGVGSGIDTGLLSLSKDGQIIDGCGTSYAAPHLAKTLACLDRDIEGYTSRETLMALVLHNSTIPECLQNKKLKKILKHVVGFGIPSSSEEILEGNDSTITLVFANRIRQGQRLRFKFSWPSSLVNNGACSGLVKLTLVSTPPFNYKFGAEFVRVNIQGHLRQEDIDDEGKTSYEGRLKPIYEPEKGSKHQKEKNLIDKAFKWASTKVFGGSLCEKGNSSNWTLDVEYLTRDGEMMPPDGVPFTALLTIQDPSGKAPVFQEMRNNLTAIGVRIADIQTAARITPRV